MKNTCPVCQKEGDYETDEVQYCEHCGQPIIQRCVECGDVHFVDVTYCRNTGVHLATAIANKKAETIQKEQLDRLIAQSKEDYATQRSLISTVVGIITSLVLLTIFYLAYRNPNLPDVGEVGRWIIKAVIGLVSGSIGTFIGYDVGERIEKKYLSKQVDNDNFVVATTRPELHD